MISFYNVISILRFAPAQINLVGDFERRGLFYDLLRRGSAAWRGLVADVTFSETRGIDSESSAELGFEVVWTVARRPGAMKAAD